MARKSRKAVIQAALDGQPMPEECKAAQPVIWNVGGYVRLSIMETRDRKDSQALSNQKELLRNFVSQKPDLKLCGLYADNGETGTNFDRSEFQRMMADIQAGRINCVVVKDLSRFGRIAMEAGDYLERVFPFLGVRFISIGDGYDSAAPNAGDALTVALRNLVNEAYSMDISRKSGSVLRQKQQRGEFIGAYAAYGYLRNPKDVHRIIIDPETAPIVREIFRRAAEGEGVRSILRWLNTEGILSPGTYRYRKGICLDKRFADGKPKPWGQMTLKVMLYSRKVSQDVKTAKRQCAARGECIAAYPFYGYVKGAADRRRLEVDPPAAETVRLVFSLWIEGNSIEDIAHILNERQIPSPSARKRELGAKRTSWSRLREEIPWTNQAVRVMLRNERYTGKLISLRTARQELGNPNQRAVPKEDWIVVEDAFEAIIDKETFQRAQAMFRTVPPRPPRRQTGYSLPLFYRKIVCGVCGQGLMRQKAPRTYYRCKEKHGPLAARCKAVRVYEDDLTACVLSELQGRAAVSISEADEADTKENANTLQAQITALEQQIEKQWSAKKDAFVKWDSGVISKAAYEDISAEKRWEIQRLEQEVEGLKELLRNGRSTEDEYPEQLVKAAEVSEPNREMVNALIWVINVFDDGRIEVEWNTRDTVGKAARISFIGGEH